MFDSLLSHIAPHLCIACGEVGALLCENCKNNIIQETFSSCVACGTTCGPNGICTSCRLPYQKAWCIGERTGELRQLIDRLKFERTYAAADTLADLLHEHISNLPSNTTIVPIPTIAPHVRQRGYDHALKLASLFAKKRKLPMKRLVYRKSTTMQRGANRAERLRQAQEAFGTKHILDTAAPYLIVDDVVTTGATLKAAAHVLREAGAATIWVAVVARQPLD